MINSTTRSKKVRLLKRVSVDLEEIFKYYGKSEDIRINKKSFSRDIEGLGKYLSASNQLVLRIHPKFK